MDQVARLVGHADPRHSNLSFGLRAVESLEVANRILGLLLTALAKETIINGTGELFQNALNQLQEKGFFER